MSGNEKSLGRWISLLNRHCQAYISKQLKPYNIGSGQYIFIITLLHNDGISQDKLSEIVNIDKGTTARAIKKLEEEGYIHREVDTADRRAYKLYTTKKAQDISPVIFDILNKSSDLLALNLSEEERELALILLDKMSKNAVSFLK
jgi:DNA-binding MarR family transcriptional regulator